MWHAGQTRRSGDPFLIHCVAVAAIVADIGMPPPVICAALLHDIDDSPCPPGRVTEHFGQGIADLVSAVRTSRLSEIPLSALNFPTARPPTLRRRAYLVPPPGGRGGVSDGVYGGVVEVEHVGPAAQAYPFLVGCLHADDRCGCDGAGLQGAALGVGQSRFDQRGEQVLPAALLLGVPGTQGVVAEQQRDELQARFPGHVDLFEHLERRAQRRPGILVGRALGETRGDEFALF
ncbi:HD domain-containing protein, partial [Streptomyces sp. cf124]|uniref:HD domain-containing protein n=1 Tax=Streptomyces sp. cf124 TaxID=1761903 RepID=UPI003528B8EA